MTLCVCGGREERDDQGRSSFKVSRTMSVQRVAQELRKPKQAIYVGAEDVVSTRSNSHNSINMTRDGTQTE